MKVHPLDKFAMHIQRSGKYQSVLRRMKRATQSNFYCISLLLLASIGASLAPQPFTISPREFIYVPAGDPSSLSLANSDPATFRIKSRIDLTLKPDIIPE